jgi:hypothetical protein
MNTTMESGYGMPVHPVCDMFPLMSASDLEAMAGDIFDHGLINPVVVHNGQLVDGRNRVLACKASDVPLRTVEWRDIYKGDEPLSRWIWSVNVERRHLTVDQIIAAQVELRAYEELEAAKLRMVAGGKAAGNHRPKGVTKRSHPKKREPTVRTKLAKELNVSERKVQQALNVKKYQPELLKEVQHGKIPLREAAKQTAGITRREMIPDPRLPYMTEAIRHVTRARTHVRRMIKEVRKEDGSLSVQLNDADSRMTVVLDLLNRVKKAVKPGIATTVTCSSQHVH